MKYYLKITTVIITFILLIALIQTAEQRFGSFENYLNVGYGNVPYTYK